MIMRMHEKEMVRTRRVTVTGRGPLLLRPQKSERNVFFFLRWFQRAPWSFYEAEGDTGRKFVRYWQKLVFLVVDGFLVVFSWFSKCFNTTKKQQKKNKFQKHKKTMHKQLKDYRKTINYQITTIKTNFRQKSTNFQLLTRAQALCVYVCARC